MLSLLLALVPAVAAADDAAVVGEIALQGRDAVDVWIRSPYRGDARAPDARTPTVRLIDAIDKALREKTTLFAREAKESKNLLDAKADLVAILKAVRGDVDLGRLAREGKQIEDHNRERRAAGEKPARFLVVVTIVPQADKNRYSVVLIDADEGLSVLLREEGRARPEELESQFQEGAVIGKPAPATVGSEEEAVAYLERLFAKELRPILESAGVWGSLGTIDVSTNVDDAEIRLDGFLVGTTRRGLTRMRDAPLGAHNLVVAASGYTPFEAAVQVSAGRTEAIDATMEASGGAAALVRDSAFWGGLAMAAGGMAVMVYGLSSSVDHSTGYSCVSTCSGSSWVRFGRVTDVSDLRPDNNGVVSLTDSDVTGSGPAAVPLGYSLLLTGAVWTLGPELFEDGSDAPWISVLVGLAAGGLAYGLSEALESPIVER